MMNVQNVGYWENYKNYIYTTEDCSIKSLAAKASCLVFPIFLVLAALFVTLDSCTEQPQAHIDLRKPFNEAIAKDIEEARDLAESLFYTANSPGLISQFPMNIYLNIKDKFNRINKTEVPPNLTVKYEETKNYFRQIEEINPAEKRQDAIYAGQIEELNQIQQGELSAPAPIQINPLQAIKTKCKEVLPRFHALIELYQAGGKITRANYEKEYLAIMMNELGYQEDQALGAADFEGDRAPIPFDSDELYMRIRERLGLEADLRTPFDEVDGLEPFAYLIRGDGHTNVAIRQTNGTYLIAPEFSDEGVTVLARRMNKGELQIDANEGTNIAIYAPNFPLKDGHFQGKIPNLNSCAMEACITLFAALLPKN